MVRDTSKLDPLVAEYEKRKQALTGERLDHALTCRFGMGARHSRAMGMRE